MSREKVQEEVHPSSLILRILDTSGFLSLSYKACSINKRHHFKFWKKLFEQMGLNRCKEEKNSCKSHMPFKVLCWNVHCHGEDPCGYGGLPLWSRRTPELIVQFLISKD